MVQATTTINSVVIIGGGILGVSTAAHLSRMGISITLINDGEVGNGASSRSLAWLNSARHRSLAFHRFRQAGIERYRILSDQYPDADWLCFGGGLTWDPTGKSNQIAQVYQHEKSLGYAAHLLDGNAVSSIIPGVNGKAVTPEGAIFNPNEGWVELPKLISLFTAEIVEAGGQVITDEGKADPILHNGRAIGARTENGQTYKGDALLLATGPAVPAMAATLGVSILEETPVSVLVETKPVEHPLRAVLNTPRVSIRPTRKGAFFLDAGWSEDEVRMNHDRNYEVDDWVTEGLLEEAKKILAPEPALEIAKVHFGPKPIPGGGEPVVGRLEALPDCFVAFSHSGATLGLILGEMLAEEMAFGIRHDMLATFRPERFTQAVVD